MAVNGNVSLKLTSTGEPLHKCVVNGLRRACGSSLGGGLLAPDSLQPSYKPSGDGSSVHGPQRIFHLSGGEGNPRMHGQHHNSMLSEQAASSDSQGGEDFSVVFQLLGRPFNFINLPTKGCFQSLF